MEKTALAADGVAELGFDPARLARIGAHFRAYVDDGRLPGWQLQLARRGQVVLSECYGQRDREAGLPVEADTLFRIYSMSKPITSVAAMMLFEQGRLTLRDPVATYIPAFGDLRVYRSGSAVAPATAPATSPMRVWHLLTHTAGLTYDFLHAHPVDAMYRAAGFSGPRRPDFDLAELCERLGRLPLLFEPGDEWNYSLATDVLGRVVEVASGQRLDEFLDEHIFSPLGMRDTGFHVEPADRGRLAALYAADPGDRHRPVRADELGAGFSSPGPFLSGGGGLVSSVDDYQRFCQLLLNGGVLGGVRLLSPRTVALMGENHLPGGAALSRFGRPLFSETEFDGMGFGLGFSVVTDRRATKGFHSDGELAWGGYASTAFWLDPREQLSAIFMTQLVPSSSLPIRPELRQLVYQALVD